MRDGNKYTYLFKERDMEAGGVRSNFETKKIKRCNSLLQRNKSHKFYPCFGVTADTQTAELDPLR